MEPEGDMNVPKSRNIFAKRNTFLSTTYVDLVPVKVMLSAVFVCWQRGRSLDPSCPSTRTNSEGGTIISMPQNVNGRLLVYSKSWKSIILFFSKTKFQSAMLVTTEVDIAVSCAPEIRSRLSLVTLPIVTQTILVV